ncbi:hypothetical protein GCM10023189_38880 [Nibrella saemangeumensis]|uniref:Helicase ATP-binding domain-containing protein n=1 Tax=Nibrella saemangeumensis TaxID=1084526 RepID=A0ABP8N9T8_9BACT
MIRHTRRSSVTAVPVGNQLPLFGDYASPFFAQSHTQQRIQQAVSECLLSADVEPVPPSYFRIGSDAILFPVSEAARLKANVNAIRLIKSLQKFPKPELTPQEQELLLQYVGWGGLAKVWDQEPFQLMQAGHTADAPTERWIRQFGSARLELETLLTSEEIALAEASTLNAYYTSRLLVENIWQAVSRLGFSGGRILEPAAGTGHFNGLMPDAVRKNSSVIAVEKDLITGAILQALYPEIETHLSGFEEVELENASFDLVIGNVPFGSYKVYDPHHPDLSAHLIHNYFIGKSARLVRPGGLVALITSMGTLDSQDDSFRKWLNGPGDMDLVGAIRLPSCAFEQSAGTQVTTDLLFLQRREGVSRRFFDNVYTRTATLLSEPVAGSDGDTDVRLLQVNEYFTRNPEQMLGTMTFADTVGKGGLYRGDRTTLYMSQPQELPQRLTQAIEQLPQQILSLLKDRKLDQPQSPQQPEVLNESVKIRGRFYTKSLVIRQYELLKTAFLTLIRSERAGEVDAVLDRLRAALNEHYDRFVRYFGTLTANRSLHFLDEYDPQYGTVQALEVFDKTTRKLRKADIFRHVVYPQLCPPKQAGNVEDALRLSLAYEGYISLTKMAEWLSIPAEQVRAQLLNQQLAFVEPDSGKLIDRDSFLSGNVRRKLIRASEAAKQQPELYRNVRALESVLPPARPASLVSFQLGSVWIPDDMITDFVRQTLAMSSVTIRYNRRAAEYELDHEQWTVQNRSLGTDRRTALDLIEAALNQKTVVITKTIIDLEGKERQVKDVEATTQAIQAQEHLTELFTDFIRENYSPRIEKLYNELFNSHVARQYREFHLPVYPGANSNRLLRRHQKQGVERIKEQDTLLAHVVGSGKTLTMITAAMELKRLGMAHKPLLAVQNSTVEDFAAQWRLQYPWANVYVPTAADMEAAGRKRFLQRIATNDFDGIVIPQSFLKLIPDDPASEDAFLTEELDRVEAAYQSADRRGDDRRKKLTVKRMNEIRMRIEARRKRQADRRKDNILTFDQLGIDALFLDEAHAYKRLGFNTHRRNVKGIDTAGSEQALSAMFKCRTVQAKGGRVVLATGTPISNTMAEAWTMLRYIAPQRLEEAYLTTFDQFAGTFGSIIQSFELTTAGNFKAVERFARFVNVKQLSEIYRSHVDVILNEDVIEFQQNQTLPKLLNEEYTRIQLPQTEGVQAELERIRATLKWYEHLSGDEKKKNMHIPLVMFGQARKATLDLRLLSAANPDEAGSKTNQAVQQIVRIYRESDAYQGTQLVFADLFQSPERESIWYDEDSETDDSCNGRAERKTVRFHLFEDLKRKLVEHGIPAEQIGIVPEEAHKREALFAQVRSGQIRVLMGTSERMGVGVNVQERLAALHHLDAPNRPTDFEQRNGRIIRQGNLHAVWNKPVEILTYGVEKTLDATAYGRLAIKQKFINQVLKGNGLEDSISDVSTDDDFSSISFDQMMASLSGSQTALLYTQKQLEYNRLIQQKKNWQRTILQAQVEVERARRFIAEKTSLLPHLEAEVDILQLRFPRTTERSLRIESVEVDGVAYHQDWHEPLKALFERMKGALKRHLAPQETIKVNGLLLTLTADWYTNGLGKTVTAIQYRWGNLIQGSLTTAQGLAVSLRAQVQAAEGEPHYLHQELEKARTIETEYGKKVNLPFQHEVDLERIAQEIAELQRLMEAESQAEAVSPLPTDKTNELAAEAIAA